MPRYAFAMPRQRRTSRRRLPPIAFGRSLSRRRLIILILTLILTAALVLLDLQVGGSVAGDDWRRYHGQQYLVVRVVDGDTFDLAVSDGDEPTTRVRLWGVDTPEMARRDGSPAEPFAEDATALTRELVEGKTVTVYLENHRLRGSYGRLLAYVELADGTLLNVRLIEAGFSEADNRWSHRLMPEFTQAEQRARAVGAGLWSK